MREGFGKTWQAIPTKAESEIGGNAIHRKKVVSKQLIKSVRVATGKFEISVSATGEKAASQTTDGSAEQATGNVLLTAQSTNQICAYG
jgi:hypothetical protein